MINFKSLGISTALAATALTVGTLGFTGSAEAASLIGGSITFAGGVQLTGGSALDTATGLDFQNVFSISCDGDFAGLCPNLVSFNDFTFNTFSGPLTSLWTAGTFSFDLESINIVTQNSSYLELSGQGTIKSTDPNFLDTDGMWSFSTQSPSAGGTFSFSAASKSEPVPEPATLLGLGLVGAAIAGTRRKASKS
jgi:hypothetical protein